MTTVLEDLRLALGQICRALGLSGNALTVIPLVVLGVALNMAALSAMGYMRNEKHSDCRSNALQSATQTELKVMRTVLASTLRKASGSQRRWCVARQRVMHLQTKDKRYHLKVSYGAAPRNGGGCDVEIVGSHRWKTAIAFVQC